MIFGRGFRYIFSLVLAGVGLCSAGQLYAQNIYQRMAAEPRKEISVNTAGNNKAPSKSAKKKSVADTRQTEDPALSSDITLEEDLLVPVVPPKQHAAVVAYMNQLAKALARHKRERVETMRNGEVVVATLATDALFAPNDTLLRKSASEMLQPYMRLLRHPDMFKIILVAHTDNTGSEVYTDRLSRARAEAVRRWLIPGDDDADRDIYIYAMGASDPVKPNNSQANRTLNRRLEIFIVPADNMVERARKNTLVWTEL